MSETRNFQWRMVVIGYAILLVILFFGRTSLICGCVKESNHLRGVFESGAAWVLGPPLNLIWEPELYLVFYGIGTGVSVGLEILSASGWLVAW